MSTNIYDAWRLPTQDLSELTGIGLKIREIESKTYFRELMETLLEFPWNVSAIVSLSKADPKFKKLPFLTNAVLLPIFYMKQGTSAISLSDSERATLELLIQANLSDFQLKLSETQHKELLQLLNDLLELMLRRTPGVVFLKGDRSTTYAKFWGLTAEARGYLSRTYEDFGYTDAASMGIECFGADVQAAYQAADTESLRHSILDAAQQERGRCWDEALNGNHSWQDTGLYFDLQPENFRLRMFNWLCILFSEARGRAEKEKALHGDKAGEVSMSSDQYIGLVFRSTSTAYYVNSSGTFQSVAKPLVNEAAMAEANAAYFDMIHSFGYSTQSVGAVEYVLKKHVGRGWGEVVGILRTAGTRLVESQNKETQRQKRIDEHEQRYPEILKGPGVRILYTGKLNVVLHLPDFEIWLPLSGSPYQNQLAFAKRHREMILDFALEHLQKDERRMSRIGNINFYTLSDFTVTRQSEIMLLFSMKKELLDLAEK